MIIVKNIKIVTISVSYKSTKVTFFMFTKRLFFETKLLNCISILLNKIKYESGFLLTLSFISYKLIVIVFQLLNYSNKSVLKNLST